MQEELNKFETGSVWSLVPWPNSQAAIGTKWVFKNKSHKNGVIVRNKTRLMAQDFNQEECIDRMNKPYATGCKIRIHQNATSQPFLIIKDSPFFKCYIYDFMKEEDFLNTWNWMLMKYELQNKDWLKRMFTLKEK